MNNTFAPIVERLRSIAAELTENGKDKAAAQIRAEASVIEMCASSLPNLNCTTHTEIMTDIIAYGWKQYASGKAHDLLSKNAEAIFNHINTRLADMCILGTDYVRFAAAPEGGAK